MDTQLALTTLQGLKNTIDSTLVGHQSQSQAIDLAVSQLQGVLITQADDLKIQFQGTIDTLNQKVTDKDKQIDLLQKQIIDLTNPIDPTDPTDPAVPIEELVILP